MSSEEFFRRFQRGELGDALDFIDWAGAYHLFLDRKARVEAAYPLNILGQGQRRAVLLTATGSDSKSDLLSPQLFEKIRSSLDAGGHLATDPSGRGRGRKPRGGPTAAIAGID